MFKKNFIRATLWVSLSLANIAVYAQVSNLDKPLAADTAVTVGKLPNGLTYYIKSNGKPAQKVELRLVVKSGSMAENDNQQGLAHFMEHMEFKGLKHYPRNELVNYLQKIGVRFGADLNANTGWDRTYFMLPIPTDNPANLEKGFQIVSDWAGGALITTSDVNDERHVIHEELRMRDRNAQTRLMRAFFPKMLNESRYAYRLPGGKDTIVQYADPNRIREFYHDWYRPDLMAVIVVGNISVPIAKAMINKYFGSLRNPKTERPRNYYHVAPYTTKKSMVLTDSETTSYDFTLMYPAHKIKIKKTIGDLREQLIRDIFIKSVNRKLRDLAQADKPPFANAEMSLSGSFGEITLGDEGLELDVTPVDDLKISINSAISELLGISQYGFTDTDIETVMKAYLPNYENAWKERNNRPSASFTDYFAASFMMGSSLLGIGDEYRYVKELLPTIKTADINSFARHTLLIPRNYFTMVSGPVKGKIVLPANQGLLQLVETAFKQEAKKNTSGAKATDLLIREPTAGQIVSETKDKALGTITYTLSNTIKVTIKPTDFKQDQVVFSGIKYGGRGLFGVKDKSNIAFLGNVISTMGYGQFTPAALSDFLSGKQVSVSTSMSELADEVSGNSTVKDIKTMLQLNYLKLTDARKDTALLRGWLNKMEVQLTLVKADPQNAFTDSLTKVLYNSNLLLPGMIPTNQDLNNVNVDRILEVYKEQFGNADGFNFFFVGNVDTSSLKPLIEKYLGSLPMKDSSPGYRDNGVRMITGRKAFNFYKGTDEKSVIIDMYHGDIEYSHALALRADMLAQVMTIEMLSTIREKMQAIYSGMVSASVVKLPYGHYSITAQMPCGPENVDKILKELGREVDGYKKDGVSQEDLDKVKKAMIEQYKEQIKENNVWNGELQQVYFWGNDPENFLNFQQRINSVTIEDMKATANLLLGDNNFKAVAYPKHN